MRHAIHPAVCWAHSTGTADAMAPICVQCRRLTRSWQSFWLASSLAVDSLESAYTSRTSASWTNFWTAKCSLRASNSSAFRTVATLWWSSGRQEASMCFSSSLKTCEQRDPLR